MLIGRKLTPEEQVKKWRQSLRGEERALERQIRAIATEEAKAIKSLKAAAKKANGAGCKGLALEIVRARKQTDRLWTSKAQLSSIGNALQAQLATIKVCGSLQKSSELMHSVNAVMRVPIIASQMQELQKEMMKAGIIEEMVDDALDVALDVDPDGIEEEAQAEVDKVLFELTDGLLGEATTVDTELPKTAKEKQKATAKEVDDEDIEDMQRKLEALRTV